MPEKVEITLPEGMTAEQFQKGIAAFTKKGSTPITTNQEPIIFKTIEASPTIQIRVYRDFYKGRELLSIRKFWRKDEEGPEWQPGKGVTFPYDAIDEIISGLEDMREWCSDHPSDKQEGED